MKRYPSRPVRKRLGDETGTSLVEAAFVTPLLLLLSFAVIDFALLFYVWLALGNGAGQATRYATTGQIIAGDTRENSIKKAMRDATPTLTLDDGAFSFSHLPIGGAAWLPGAGGPNEVDKLTVTYTWAFYTPLVRPFFPNGEITLKVESAVKNERKFDE